MPRPVGAPFWGESLPLSFVLDDADEFVVNIGERADGTHTLTSGETLRCWIQGSFYNYLQAGDSAVVSWVVEVTSGAGTLHLTDGQSMAALDGTATVDQGTRTATGGVETLVWSSSVSVGDLLDGACPLALIECESGTVEVQQVKLRVWPPGGPLGELSDPTTEPVGSAVTNVTFGQYHSSSSMDGPPSGFDWPDMEAAIAANLTEYLDNDAGGYTPGVPYAVGVGEHALLTNEPNGVFVGGGASYVSAADQDTGAPFWWDASFTSYRFTGWVRGLMPAPRTSVPGTEGVDWIYHPNEVWPDPVASAYTTGPIETWWPALELDVTASTPGDWSLTAHESAAPTFPTPITAGTFTWPTLGDLLTSATGSADASIAWTPTAGVTTFQVDLEADASDLGSYNADGSPLVVALALDLIDPTTTFGQFAMRYRRPEYRVWIPRRRLQPHQIFQRGDSLGAGPARVYDPGTRQTTERVYGTH